MNDNLVFINSFQFLLSSLVHFVKCLGKGDFKCLRQKFDSKVVDLVKKKQFCPYEYVSGFEKFKEKLPSKKKFFSLLTGKKISDKDYEHVYKV